jgi:hypothetical protein
MGRNKIVASQFDVAFVALKACGSFTEAASSSFQAVAMPMR